MASLGQTSSPIAGSSSSNQSTTTEYTVRAPSTSAKKFSMIKFSSGTNIDFLKLTNTSVKMERQNNLREYKTAYNIDTMPKFGAGSEYGREQKEEARRKKYGIDVKKYNPEDQPWLMKVGKGKDAKRFKGGREGTITENTSYYIFTQCADGAFDAFPVEEWYNFQSISNYKFLNSEEAEEEFSRRDKTMNLFSIMVKKRIRNEDDTGETDEAEKKAKAKAKKKDKSLILTDMEDWTAMSDEEEEDEDGEDKEDKPKKDKKGDKKKRRKNAKINDNDEAVEESDEGDFDDRELDYITDSGSESDLDDKEKEDKYDDKGVDQEQGLKKLIDSEEESSEDEDKKEEDDLEEDEQEAETEKKSKKKKESKEGDESDSSSSSSESDDSDIEKNEDKFSSVLFMQEKKGSSRSATPTVEKPVESSKTESKSEAVKRKVEPEDSPDQQKKMRTESPSATSAANLAFASGEITEEAIRRYLMRKPMTAKDLVQKFGSKKCPQMSKEQMTQKIGQLLKKINPDRKYVNNVLYLSVKKTE